MKLRCPPFRIGLAAAALILVLGPSVSMSAFPQQVIDLQHPEPPFATIVTVSPFAYVCITHQGPYTDIPNLAQALMTATQSQRIYPQGPMIVVYYNSPEMAKPEDLTWEVGFPVTSQAMPDDPLIKKVWDYGTVARAIYVGPYENIGTTINRLFAWIAKSDYVPEGPMLERYLDLNPTDVDPAKRRTEIWIAVKAKSTPRVPGMNAGACSGLTLSLASCPRPEAPRA